MSNRYVAIVPAAGAGSRFGAALPKQYLPLNGKPLIWHTVRALMGHELIARVLVVISPDDTWWHADCLPLPDAERVMVAQCGGQTRAESVLNGIRWLQTRGAVADSDWVLVHDAARPCLTARLIDDLIGAVGNHPVGGLLAIPVADTLKRADASQQVMATVDRRQLWQAQTPQMFRSGLLAEALSSSDLQAVTDESSAIEALGHTPLLVPGALSNLKVTYPEDLTLATAILHSVQPSFIS